MGGDHEKLRALIEVENQTVTVASERKGKAEPPASLEYFIILPNSLSSSLSRSAM